MANLLSSLLEEGPLTPPKWCCRWVIFLPAIQSFGINASTPAGGILQIPGLGPLLSGCLNKAISSSWVQV